MPKAAIDAVLAEREARDERTRENWSPLDALRADLAAALPALIAEKDDELERLQKSARITHRAEAEGRARAEAATAENGRLYLAERERAEEAEAALANSEAQVRLLRQRSGPKAVEAALAQQLREIREALKPFADLADEADAFRHEDNSTCEWRLKASDLRRARALLNRTKDAPELPGEGQVEEKLREFDAWLSFRPEFAEVLTAFRSAFGTDTSASGSTPQPVSGLGEVSANARMLDEFHRLFNYERTTDPSLRRVLHQEEHEELVEALESGDLEAIARELADVVYVAYGSAWSLNVDLDAAIREVHRANLSKLDDDGKPVYRQDGKVLKGPNFRPPDLRLALEGHPVTIDQERGGIFLAASTPQSPQPQPGDGKKRPGYTEIEEAIWDAYTAGDPGDGSGVEERLRREVNELRRALEPFATFARGHEGDAVVEAHPDHPGDGRWTDLGVGMSRDRIVDWFGPTAFFTAAAALRLSTQQPQLAEAGECEEVDVSTIPPRQFYRGLKALVQASAPVESGEASEDDRERFAEAFQDACFLLAGVEHGTGEKQPRLGSVEEIRTLLLADEIVDRVAEENAIEDLYGWWEDKPSRENKEARQRQRYAQLAKKRGVQESWKEGARRDINRFLDILAAALTQPQDGQPRCDGTCQAVVLDNGYCDGCGKPVFETARSDEQPRCGGSGEVDRG